MENENSSAQTEVAHEKKKPNYPGPKPGIKYPLNVLYCGVSGLPIELIEYAPDPDACKEWLDKNHPDFNSEMNNLKISDSATGGGDEEQSEKKSAHQKRGGKGMPKAKKEKQPSKIIISKNQRKGNKYVTIISGLSSNDVDLESAKKFFAQRFSCGCSKGDNDELVIQGDFVDVLFNVIPEKFPQITADMMEEKEK